MFSGVKKENNLFLFLITFILRVGIRYKST